MTQWKKLLKSFGFTESEASVYVTSLEMGPSSVLEIAKRAKVSRVTTYSAIESLAKRGLMSSLQKDDRKLFIAESPERLVSFVNARMSEMTGALKEVEASMQELKLIQRGEKPVVKMFEGPEAQKFVMEDFLSRKPKETFEFGNVDDFRSLYSKEIFDDYHKKMQLFHPVKRLVYLSKTGEKRVYAAKEGEVLNLPTNLDFHGDVIVYEDKVAISSLIGKQITVIIESNVIAKTIQTMIELIWKSKN